MIARIWHGVTMADKADAFMQFVRKTGEQAYLKSPGNQGVHVLRRRFDDKAEFLLVSFWDSIESIKLFAGEDYKKAVYPYVEDKLFLIELEIEVKHFDVITKPNGTADQTPMRLNFFNIY
jgi:heme-degrading monooxygenase HmoA